MNLRERVVSSCIGLPKMTWVKLKVVSEIGCLAVIACLLFCPGPTNAQAESDPPYGNHFILLIDDSGDAGDVQKYANLNIPNMLYSNPNVKSENDLPTFNPEKDDLSVAFYAIYKNASTTVGIKRNSTFPKYVFTWKLLENSRPDKADFTKWLEAWLKEDLHANQRAGNDSPHDIVRFLALGAVDRYSKLKNLYSRTFIITYSNDVSNDYNNTADELDKYKGKVADVEETGRLINEIEKYFYFDHRPEWEKKLFKTVSGKTSYFYYRLYEVKPKLNSLSVYLNYPNNLNLDRIAIDKESLLLVPEFPGGGTLSIKRMTNLEPLNLYRRSQKEYSNESWHFGKISLFDPPEYIDLKKVPVDADGSIAIPFVEKSENLRFNSRQQEAMPSGKTLFKVFYQFKPSETKFPLYSQIVISDEVREINLKPIPDETIVGGPFVDDVILDYATHAKYWRPSDVKGLTRAVAIERIRAEMARRQWLSIAGLVLVVILLIAATLFWLFLRHYRMPFKPDIAWKWLPINLDFNNLPLAPIPVGFFRVNNAFPFPWFGKLLGNKEQPSGDAKLITQPSQPLDQYGFKLSDQQSPTIGFFSPGGESPHPISVESRETLVHGKSVLLYCNPDNIVDFMPQSEGAEVSNEKVWIDGQIQFDWEKKISTSRGKQIEALPFKWEFLLIPEIAKPPMIEFRPCDQPLNFCLGQRLFVGDLILKSNSDHAFATPFQDRYFVQAFNERRPMGGSPFVLEEDNLTVPAQGERIVGVFLVCDGALVPNPHPREKHYQFSLLGPHQPGSETGPFPITLRRDPRPGRPIFEIEYLGQRNEVFWDPNEAPGLRLLKQNLRGSESPLIKEQEIHFADAFPVGFFRGDQASSLLLELKIGNSGDSGKGVVHLHLFAGLEIDESHRKHLHLTRKSELADLIEIKDLDGNRLFLEENRPLFSIKEGEKDQYLAIHFNPWAIERIDDGLIDAGHCRLTISTRILAWHDRDANGQNQDELHETRWIVPLSLEQKPGPTWMCIDFGTSAITVALGRDDDHDVSVIDLQKVEVAPQVSFGRDDPSNMENGSKFLPSWVLCCGEKYPGKTIDPEYPPGFHSHLPGSSIPGEPGFLSVPPHSGEVRESPDKVIFSIKSWVATGADKIVLRSKINVKGHNEPTNLISAQDTLASALAALVETYILPARRLTDQIVLSCPNTFTGLHRSRLRKAAEIALVNRLNLISRRNIVLMSESDAVAYFYCYQRMREGSAPQGKENILVYDCGGGTIDLTVIQVTWSQEARQPEHWSVLARLGVPIAGNYIDEILARLVHRLLIDPEIVPENEFSYKFQLVEDPSKNNKIELIYRDAVMKFWLQLKSAKHKWDGKCDLEIKVGEIDAGSGLVHYVGKNFEDIQINLESSTGLKIIGVDIYLKISANTIYNFDSLNDFIDFSTNRTLQEVIDSSGLTFEQVDTLLVSGRGALFPGIMGKLNSMFPEADKPDILSDSNLMKEAVARGAIAYQKISQLIPEEPAQTHEGKIAVLTDDGRIFGEDQWGAERPIPMAGVGSFRLVRVLHRNPNPRKDLKNLNRYFFQNLSPTTYLKTQLWSNSPLFVEKELVGDDLRITLKNNLGQKTHPLDPKAQVGIPIEPPWPIGRTLLSPEEQT